MRSKKGPARLLAVVMVLLGSAGRESTAQTPGDTLQLRDVLAMVAEGSAVVRAAEAAVGLARAQETIASAYHDPVIRLEAEAGGSGVFSAGPSRWSRTYRASVVQQTAWGVEIAPSFSWVPGTATAMSAWSAASGATSALGLTVSVPLLRTGRRNPQRLSLEAARLGAAAAEKERAHVLAAELLSGTLAYWELRAAHERLRIVEDAAGRSREVRNDVKRLVVAGERAASDEVQASAFLADRLTDVALARQQVWERAARLGTACDVPADRFLNARFAEEAPVARASTKVRTVDTRHDVASQQLSLKVARLLSRMRSISLLPNVSLAASMFEPLQEATTGLAGGPAARVSLSLSGNMLRSSARGEQAAQRARTLERAARLDRTLVEARNRLQAAQAAVSNASDEFSSAVTAREVHLTAVANERRRLSAGFATVFDVILAEDRLTGAELAVADARMRLAQSIARRAFESGNVVDRLNESADVRAARLLGRQEEGDR